MVPNHSTLPYLQTLRVHRLSPDAHARGAIDLILPQLQTLKIDPRHLERTLTRSDLQVIGLLDTLRVFPPPFIHHFPNNELVRNLTVSPARVTPFYPLSAII
jgi:hypothetical protein